MDENIWLAQLHRAAINKHEFKKKENIIQPNPGNPVPTTGYPVPKPGTLRSSFPYVNSLVAVCSLDRMVCMKFKFTFKLYSMFVVLTTVRYSMFVS